MSYVLGFRMAECHHAIQNFITKHKDCYISAARGHGKSSQISIGRVAWEIGCDINIRVKLVSSNLPEARKTCAAVKTVIESEKYQQVFPHVKPDLRNWGSNSITVKRDNKGKRDATVEAAGVFGRAGGRADLLVFDDICDAENAIRQAAKRDQVKMFVVNNWMPMLVREGRMIRTGTPYHSDDIMADWKRETQVEGLPYLELKCDGVKSSPWPEEFSPERLAEARSKWGNIAYARAMELVPLSGDETVWKERDLRDAFSTLPKNKQAIRIGACDLAFTEKTGSITKNTDPDYSVLAIADLTPEGHVYMVRLLRMRTTSPKWAEAMLKEVDKLRPSYIIMEESGPLKGLVQEYREKLRVYGCTVRAIARGTDKFTRAVETQHVVEDGRFHIRADDDGEVLREMRPLFDEMCEFPVSGHDDCADCAIDLMSQARTPKPEQFKAASTHITYQDIRDRNEERKKAEAAVFRHDEDFGGNEW